MSARSSFIDSERWVFLAVVVPVSVSVACGGRADAEAVDRLAADGSTRNGSDPSIDGGSREPAARTPLPPNRSPSSRDAATSSDHDAGRPESDAGSPVGGDAVAPADASGALTDAVPDAPPLVPDCSAGFVPDAFDGVSCPVLSGGLCFSTKADVCACLACEERCILQFAICGSASCSFPASARCVCADYPRCN